MKNDVCRLLCKILHLVKCIFFFHFFLCFFFWWFWNRVSANIYVMYASWKFKAYDCIKDQKTTLTDSVNLMENKKKWREKVKYEWCEMFAWLPTCNTQYYIIEVIFDCDWYEYRICKFVSKIHFFFNFSLYFPDLFLSSDFLSYTYGKPVVFLHFLFQPKLPNIAMIILKIFHFSFLLNTTLIYLHTCNSRSNLIVRPFQFVCF